MLFILVVSLVYKNVLIKLIAFASIVSKVLKKIIYDRIAYSLITCDNEFGLKAKHSTDMYVYIYMPSKRLY